ncbi:GFA family protein [Rhizobium sp. KVB221]|uniref:GFA family protein n=1 Tax=Rhizobium setariae TaxID=2801340 RepID=A0A937CNX7_9HYPH|nr:GFA family protein [Rhizobium setariae]MBL0371182.1 GFA family protein [Rhizobium setariae]
MIANVHTGGCQCGAVRFRLEGKPGQASICHCRMCQKAFGAFYAPLVSVGAAKFAWTRGRPKMFRSSNYVLRGFCKNCGTPLSYEAPDGIGLAIGAFDVPGRLPPVVQFGIEAKIPFVDQLHELAGHDTMDDLESAPFLSDLVTFQHPDHDTTGWEPRVDAEAEHWRPKEEGV